MRIPVVVTIGCILFSAVTRGGGAPGSAAFVYQGQLKHDGVPVTDVCFLVFTLWDDPESLDPGHQVTPLFIVRGANVTNGLFSVELDFGANSFDGEDRWVETSVACPAGAAAVKLSPRVAIHATPFALQTRGLHVNQSADTIQLGNDNSVTVGIGTDAPEERLHVSGGLAKITSHAPGIRLEEQDETPPDGLWQLRVQSDIFQVNRNTAAAGDFASLITPLALTPSGRVGIGTASPDADFHVRGASSLGEAIITPGEANADAQLRLTENTSASLGAIMRYSGAANQWQVLGLNNDGETLPHLVVERNSGQVGIGTTNPSNTLHVSGSGVRIDGTGGLNIRNPNNTGAVVRFDWLNDVPRLRLGGNGVGAANGFDIQRPGDTSLLRILDNGNVGIGTAEPQERFHVTGTLLIDYDGEDNLDISWPSSDQLVFGERPIFNSPYRTATIQSVAQSGVITLYNAADLSKIQIGSSSSRGYLSLNDELGLPRTTLSVDDNGGRMELLTTNGIAKVQLYVEDPDFLPAVGVISADIKNFRAPNPRDPETEIVYACVEGPEAGAYARGTAMLVRGRSVVRLSEHFRDVVVADGMTIQLTPHSAQSKGLAVISRSLNEFSVAELFNGEGSYEFDWEVKAIRSGYENYAVIQPARSASVESRPAVQR